MSFSGSSLERVAACPTSAALPQVREESTEHADRGTAVHAFLAAVGKVGREKALEEVPEEYRDACAAIDLDALPSLEGFAAEVAFAYDWQTGTAREIGRDRERDYGILGATEIPLTVDAVGFHGDGVVVVDWKSGRRSVTPARYNWQLRLGALAACRTYGYHRATVAIVYVRDGSRPWFDRAEFDEFDIETVADEVRAVALRVQEAAKVVKEGRAPNVTEGAHCRYCPAVRSCPAKTGLIRAAVGAPATFAEGLAALMPEQVGEVWEKATAALSLLHKLRAEIEAMTREHGPIPLPSGKVLQVVQTQQERVTNGQAVYEYLSTKHGADVAMRACEIDSSKSAIREALRPVAKQTGEKLAQLEREALAALRDAGAITSKVGSRVDEVPARKEEAA